jgi:hypothetical protein
MHMDKVTEAIAHFIGLFQITAEQARLRKDYAEFDRLKPTDEDPSELEQSAARFRSPYGFNDPDPGLHYVPRAPEIVKLGVGSKVIFEPPHIPVSQGLPSVEYTGRSYDGIGQRVPSDLYEPPRMPQTKDFEIDPPGQVAVNIAQENYLYDDDYVSAGGHGLVMARIDAPGTALDALAESAVSANPLSALEAPGSTSEIAAFIEHAAVELRKAAEAISAEGGSNGSAWDGTGTLSDHFGLHARVIEGTYISGEAGLAPKLDDLLPAVLREEEEGPKDDRPTNTADTGPSVTVHAGANFLINEAIIQNKMLSAAVFATAGKHVEVNAVTQVNVWSDADSIGGMLEGWSQDKAVTQALNIAEFKRLTPDDDATGSDAAGFPKAWAVTKITGDLIFANWIKQVNFVSDSDVHVLSASGAKTIVTSGVNTAVNAVNINELGLYFDLILVGGNIYDGNFISQMNVMLDDDLVGAVKGFETAGPGELSTGGNLLWNKATILNVGDADRFEALPAQYRTLIDKIGAGDESALKAALSDSAFLGLEGLRVLYVSGGIYDLQLISQTNILGDADELALAMEQALARPDADWTITTGSNALVNVAGILDVDAGAKTYVGKGQFSDEFLVQTEIIKVDPLPAGEDADALVSEAVAFLADDIVDADPGDPSLGVADPSGVHSAHTDVMQAVVS